MEARFQLNDIFVVSGFSLCPSCQHNFSSVVFSFHAAFSCSAGHLVSTAL